ncbi:MAG: hypothetical protein QT04_C0050G0027 [archaeon GW2011_AR11]|nr:MAG: hypothetical protein QT04_C0050G0027 [archaeon GW2011_AR11]
MDSNVKLMKELLEDGYKITIHQINMQRVDNINVMTDTVTLEKGKDKKTIVSTNSAEFFDYITHFKQIKDKYGNIEFTYINNLELYNKNFKGSQGDVFLRDQHSIKVSGREFKEGIITMHLNPSGPKNREGRAMFRINLEKNPELREIDLKDEIFVYEPPSNELKFKGLVKEFFISDGEAYLISQDITLRLSHQKISAEFNKMKPEDCMSLMVSTAGLTFCPDKSIKFNTSEREFIIIVPVKNLIINDSFKIAEMEFYQIFNTLDDSLIRKSETGRREEVWNGNYPRAKIKVKAKTFYEAILKGYMKISKAIDVIALRTDLSFPNIKISDKITNIPFDYFKYCTRVKVPTWVYCREFESEGYTFFNMEWLTENILALELHPDKYFESVNNLFQKILTQESLNQEESNILQVIRWLRRAIQIGDNKDKLIDLWTAVEFLLSGTSSEVLFSDDEKESLITYISSLNNLNGKQKNALYSKFNMLNDSPLMKKFNTLINDLGISFSDEELNTLKTTRSKRNDLIHGKRDINVKEDELNKIRTIIEKILIAKIQKISN